MSTSKSDEVAAENSPLEIVNLLIANKNKCLTFANHWKTYFSEAKHLNESQSKRYFTFASDFTRLLANESISQENAELFLKQHGKIVADLALKYGLDALASQNFSAAIDWLKVTNSLSQFASEHFAEYYLQMARQRLQATAKADDAAAKKEKDASNTLHTAKKDDNDTAKKDGSCIIRSATP